MKMIIVMLLVLVILLAPAGVVAEESTLPMGNVKDYLWDGSVPFHTIGEDGEPEIVYYLSGGVVIYTWLASRESDRRDIVIPAEVDGMPVSHVAMGAFDQTNIHWYGAEEHAMDSDHQYIAAAPVTVTFAEGLTRIGGLAFCMSVEEVTLPSTAKTLDAYAFHGCNKLRVLRLPENLETIQTQALSNTAIPTLTIPASVQLIEEDADAFGQIWTKFLGRTTEIKDSVGSVVYAYIDSTAEKAALEQGAIFISLGDATDDGNVNNKDFARIKAYLADDAVQQEMVAADITGDDLINNKDLARLKAYLADDMIE